MHDEQIFLRDTHDYYVIWEKRIRMENSEQTRQKYATKSRSTSHALAIIIQYPLRIEGCICVKPIFLSLRLAL